MATHCHLAVRVSRNLVAGSRAVRRSGFLTIAGFVAVAGFCLPAVCRGDGGAESEESQISYEYVCHSGFVFLNGDYIPGPYQVRQEGKAVTVNGIVLPPYPEIQYEEDLEEVDFEDDDGYDLEYEIKRVSEGDKPYRRLWRYRSSPGRRLVHDLEEDAAVVGLPGEPLLVCREYTNRHDLFLALAKQGHQEDLCREFCNTLPRWSNKDVWRDWICAFQPSRELMAILLQEIKAVDDLVSEADARVNAIYRLDRLAYPLTVLGMCITVLAFGHLLMCLPRPYDDVPVAPSAGMLRATTYSLILVAVLSGLDLVWTILASQAGQMKELNPLASSLIANPLSLVAFKVAATTLGCGLLYHLRHSSRAQLATWWLCLVCTVLAFRWLTFNSIFVA